MFCLFFFPCCLCTVTPLSLSLQSIFDLFFVYTVNLCLHVWFLISVLSLNALKLILSSPPFSLPH